MPKGNDLLYFIYINIGFILLNMAIIFFGSVSEIKKNWSKYRCNPMYMWLSEDIQGDFNGCIETTQSNFMPELLAPLNSVVGGLSTVGLGISNDLQSGRNMFASIRDKITSVFDKIFGIFINLIMEFTKIAISLKDMMYRILGVAAVVVYTMDTAVKSMEAGRSLMFDDISALTCFHPDTKIKLQNNKIQSIKDILPGSILENGAKVSVVLNIEKSEPLYLLKNMGVNEEDIYVSGSHFILYNNKFILVKNHPKAISQTKIQSDTYFSLITSDHIIKIGNTIFWDWEDDDLYI